MKKCGLILADNGSNLYISGMPAPAWNDNQLVSELKRVKGADFEAVDGTVMMLATNSVQ